MVYCIQDTHNHQHRGYVHRNYEQIYQFNINKAYYFISISFYYSNFCQNEEQQILVESFAAMDKPFVSYMVTPF